MDKNLLAAALELITAIEAKKVISLMRFKDIHDKMTGNFYDGAKCETCFRKAALALKNAYLAHLHQATCPTCAQVHEPNCPPPPLAVSPVPVVPPIKKSRKK